MGKSLNSFSYHFIDFLSLLCPFESFCWQWPSRCQAIPFPSAKYYIIMNNKQHRTIIPGQHQEPQEDQDNHLILKWNYFPIDSMFFIFYLFMAEYIISMGGCRGEVLIVYITNIVINNNNNNNFYWKFAVHKTSKNLIL